MKKRATTTARPMINRLRRIPNGCGDRYSAPDRLKDVETVDEDARARDHAKHTDHRVPAAACAGTAADEKSGPEKQGSRSGQTSRFEASVSTKK